MKAIIINEIVLDELFKKYLTKIELESLKDNNNGSCNFRTINYNTVNLLNSIKESQ